MSFHFSESFKSPTSSSLRTPATLILASTALCGLSACVANTPDSGNSGTSPDTQTQNLAVTITDDTCKVSADTVPQGRISFSVKNQGTVRNEFEILAEDQLRIVGERENLGPGTVTDYTIVLKPGTYYTACKKNMLGALVGVAPFTVTGEGEMPEVNESKQQLIDNAVTHYTAYVRDQAGQLLEETKRFAQVYASGNTEEAKNLYAATRQFYERIEPTAEAFGDIDPALDEREVDYQEDPDNNARSWTGWHVIEKDLWGTEGVASGIKTAEERTHISNQLVADTQKLYDLVYSEDFSVSIDEISNGAIALLEEVAISKITGEEEIFSHTDLWDFHANVEGAMVAFGNVKALAAEDQQEQIGRAHV